MFRLKLLASAMIALCLVFPAPGGISAETDEPILLTIEFSTADEDETTVHEFRYSDLAAFPASSFMTTTNWTNGPQTFTGVPLLAVLDATGATAGQMEMVAINEYSISMAIDDPTNVGALIAYSVNGEPMTPRGKGPLWLVYDYDSDPTYRTETVYSRSIWQLDRIIISR